MFLGGEMNTSAWIALWIASVLIAFAIGHWMGFWYGRWIEMQEYIDHLKGEIARKLSKLEKEANHGKE